MEIIGFMVIILLLFFALLFYFRFSSQEGTDLVEEAEQNLEVSHLLSVIQLYTVCDDTQLGDAIKECIDNGFACGEDACGLVEREVQQIVALNGWANESYMFYIGDTLYSPGECKGNTFVDDYTTGGVDVRLVYCYL